MIVCPNCEHVNPEGALHCENCSTPLPSVVHCPSCGAPVQSDASFCGQCGFDLRSGTAAQVPLSPPPESAEPAISMSRAMGNPGEGQDEGGDIPSLMPPDPLVVPEPIPGFDVSTISDPGLSAAKAEGSTQNAVAAEATAVPPEATSREATGSIETPPSTPDETATAAGAAPVSPQGNMMATQLQVSQSRLIHLQTNTTIELPPNVSPLHIGKPNDRVPPDVDVSGFPNSEIVSRVHADIRVEGDTYYIEDVNSSNGTYINNLPLPPGNRHRLRPGDRIALGKGDKVTFIFQTS